MARYPDKVPVGFLFKVFDISQNYVADDITIKA